MTVGRATWPDSARSGRSSLVPCPVPINPCLVYGSHGVGDLDQRVGPCLLHLVVHVVDQPVVITRSANDKLWYSLPVNGAWPHNKVVLGLYTVKFSTLLQLSNEAIQVVVILQNIFFLFQEVSGHFHVGPTTHQKHAFVDSVFFLSSQHGFESCCQL